MKDYTVKAYCYNEYLRIYACNSTELVETARKLHCTWPTATAALGRALTVCAMMSLMYKMGEHLTFKIDGNGPIGEMIIDASYGVVKGSIHNPEVFLQYNDGHLAVGKAVGNDGYIYVTKDLHMREPFTSIARLQTGEIGDDFTYYFASSEQIPSSVGVGVLVNPDNSCAAAGGFILQVMPGCPEEILTKVEEKLKNLKPVSKMIEEGYTPEMIINEVTDGDYKILESNPIKYECDCSRERFMKGIASLGRKEIQEMIDTDGHAEVLCHFCMKKYDFNKEDLEKIRDEYCKVNENKGAVKK